MSATLGALLAQATARLKTAGVDDPARDARALVAMAAGIAPDRLSLALQDMAGAQVAGHLATLVELRAARRPMAQILGRRAFYRHEFRVTADVLDPRPDTETLVEAALTAPFAHVLDLGTGSGCILLSLLAARPMASGVGTDLSPAALDVAHDNAARLGLTERCLLVHGDWYSPVEGRFDLIVSNPPYIAAAEMPGLAPDLSHEPRMALTDEGDGLSAYRVIVPGAGAHLRAGGRLMVETGWQQGAAVAELFTDAGFDTVKLLPDLAGRDRVVCGSWGG
ncbi:MAG: peptide chain release factor N(5)-glutamine methyltransferase [Rhodobacteraceae bacterium]|nr:peptide chain release factor N(5)-glutamine methyltransferase [Paracoccaceae bacterium]